MPGASTLTPFARFRLLRRSRTGETLTMTTITPKVSSNQQRKLVVLDNIHVAAPCPADWMKMSGNDRVRHCCECNLNVYNISEMTRAQAEELIRTHEGRLCVRFYRRADGTILTKDCPCGLQVLIRRVSRVAAAVLTAAMTVGSTLSYAVSKKPAQAEENQSTAGINVTVVDPTGAVVQNANAVLCRCNDHFSVHQATDSTGIAHFSGLAAGTYQLEIRAPGFKTAGQNLRLQSRKLDQLKIKLQLAPTKMTVTVEVKGETPVVIETVGMLLQNPVALPFPSTGVAGRPGLLR